MWRRRIDPARSCPRLQDLFLLHDPCAGPEKRLSAWKTLEQKQEEGKLQAIGVSNFVRRLGLRREPFKPWLTLPLSQSEIHLKQLVDGGAETVPEVNQVSPSFLFSAVLPFLGCSTFREVIGDVPSIYATFSLTR